MNVETTISEYGDHITTAKHQWDTQLKEFTKASSSANQRVDEAFHTLTLSAMRAHHQAGRIHATTVTSEEADSNTTNSLAFGTPVILIRLALTLVNVAAFLLRHDTETSTRLQRTIQEVKAKTPSNTPSTEKETP